MNTNKKLQLQLVMCLGIGLGLGVINGVCNAWSLTGAFSDGVRTVGMGANDLKGDVDHTANAAEGAVSTAVNNGVNQIEGDVTGAVNTKVNGVKGDIGNKLK